MKDWQPTSFSPRTGLLYIPHQNLCEDVEGMAASYIAGTPYVGASVVYKAGPGGNRGVFTAWDPVAAKAGVGDQGELSGVERHRRDRRRRRLLRDDGRLVQGGRTRGPATLLWQFKCGSGIIGQPIVYKRT